MTLVDWQEYGRCVNIFLTGKGRGVDVDFSKRRLVAIGHSMGGAALCVPICICLTPEPVVQDITHDQFIASSPELLTMLIHYSRQSFWSTQC